MPRKQPAETRAEGWTGWTLQPDGTIDIPIRGTTYSLAAPTIGQLRDIELAHAKANARTRANLEALTAGVNGEEEAAKVLLDPVAQTEAKYERVDIWVGWWIDAVWPTIGIGATPSKDDLPPWLTLAQNTIAALAHWQSTPPGPGGG